MRCSVARAGCKTDRMGSLLTRRYVSPCTATHSKPNTQDKHRSGESRADGMEGGSASRTTVLGPSCVGGSHAATHCSVTNITHYSVTNSVTCDKMILQILDTVEQVAMMTLTHLRHLMSHFSSIRCHTVLKGRKGVSKMAKMAPS